MRDRLPDRRPSVTMAIDHALGSGALVRMLVTYSFDSEGRVREVFCADFKAGSDFHTVVVDASILVSRLLQEKLRLAQVLASLSDPPSLIGSMLKAGIELEDP